ncbi:hypothetical protein [Streptomyces murinus]|uniref:hypothetical protein n=1 Tax=Streptomyces murinus TaxID=33900 RepID=UPI00118095AE
MTDRIRRRWRALPPWARVILVVADGGFLEGTGAHALDLARHGPHAYSSFAPPLQVFHPLRPVRLRPVRPRLGDPPARALTAPRPVPVG